jgi:hypothetical protein
MRSPQTRMCVRPYLEQRVRCAACNLLIQLLYLQSTVLNGVQVVGGSNPLAPTRWTKGLTVKAVSPFFLISVVPPLSVGIYRTRRRKCIGILINIPTVAAALRMLSKPSADKALPPHFPT